MIIIQIWLNKIKKDVVHKNKFISLLENKFSINFLSSDKKYSPQNYGDVYGNKAISMAEAIAVSDNVYAVKTHLFLGEEAMINTAYKMGIKTKLEQIPSLPLGTNSLNIIEITNAYATLASGGIYNEPFLINKVTDMDGNILYEHKNIEETVLNYDYVYILNNLLSLTYDYDLIDYAYPTNISIKALLSNKYAIKSGSTSTDNWIIGFNKDIVTSIWVGNDDNSKLEANKYKYIKKIWANSVETYLKDKDCSWYIKPENVVGVFANPVTGEIADENTKKRKILYYVKGTEPSYIQDVFDELSEKK